MIEARFFNFPKRENSSKQPTGAGASINITIKVPSSIEEPTLEIHDASIKDYNYVYIPYYSRYYFIVDRECIAQDCYIIQCRCDTLASFKSELAGQNVFMEYSSANRSRLLIDNRIQPSTNFLSYVQTANLDLFESGRPIFNYCRVITDQGKDNGTDVYATQSPQAGPLTNLITTLANQNGFNTLLQGLGGGDPFKSICEIWQSPLAPDKCHLAVDNRQGDVWGFIVPGTRITDYTVKQHIQSFVIDHSHDYDDFRDRYTVYNLYLPWVGMIDLPQDLMFEGSAVNIRYGADACSGQLAYSVNIQADNIDYNVGTYGATLKSSMGLASQQSQQARWAEGAANTLTGAIGGAIAGAKVGGGVGAAVGALGGAAVSEAMTFASMAGAGKVNKVGSFTGGTAFLGCGLDGSEMRLHMRIATFNHAPDYYAAIAGYPCQGVHAIANGYIKARNASVSISGTDNERRTINALLNGGIYYE